MGFDDSEERTLVDSWLQALGRRTGLSLQLDGSGVCAIGHQQGLECAIEVPAGSDTVYLRSPLMPWQEDTHPRLAEWCLARHFLGIDTGGASFAIDRLECELVLWLACPLPALDEDRFCRQMVAFLESALACKEQLDAFYRNDPQVPQVPKRPGDAGQADPFGRRA